MRYAKTHMTDYTVRADEDGKKYISGYFSVFDDVYQITENVSESIRRTAFDKTINDDIRALTNHDTTLVLGRTIRNTLKLNIDDHGLFGEIEINEDDMDAMNLYRRVQRGDVSQCSFGFEILDESFEDITEGKKTHRHYTINEVKLYEVSCVTFPAYESTSVQARAKDEKELADRLHEAWKASAKKKLGGQVDAESITEA